MSSNNPGDIVTVYTDPPFSDENDDPMDPTNVRFYFRRKGHPPTKWVYGIDAQITRTAVGTYSADITLVKPGTYYARWEGDGAVTAAEELSFTVSTLFDTGERIPQVFSRTANDTAPVSEGM